MSNIEGFEQPNTSSLYASYKFADSSFRSDITTDPKKSLMSSLSNVGSDDIFTQSYYIPLDSVRTTVIASESAVYNTKIVIEQNLLSKIYIDPNIDPGLEQAHVRIWHELSNLIFKNPDISFGLEAEYQPVGEEGEDGEDLDEDAIQTGEDVIYGSGDPSLAEFVTKETVPSYICFDEFSFAEKHLSTAARKLITEYKEAISLTTFSYFFQLRKLLDLFLREIACIKQSLLVDFGEQYENESQQQVALQYDSWAKAALHYTSRVAKIIATQSRQLPSAEVDQISKKQAAQFQAFFAVRLNAVDSEIEDILSSLQRDLVDNCEIFYHRYLTPAMKLNKDISDPLEFDFNTTAFQSDFPSLAGELLVTTNVLKGNFVSVHADLLDRLRLMMERTDSILMLIHEKKKYANFISQLGNKAIQKNQVLRTITNDVFSQFFRSAPLDSSKSNSLISSHSDLDGLEENSHPQYLLRDGGVITGNIQVGDGYKIDGVDVSHHKHTGSDGSSRISILDIDYTVVRESSNSVEEPFSVYIEGFIPDIIDGGIPVFDAVVAIEIGDEGLEGYEYEILYTEIES